MPARVYQHPDAGELVHPRSFVACNCLELCQRPRIVAGWRNKRGAAGTVQLSRRLHEALDFGLGEWLNFLRLG
jgi:hypothetical protein